MTVNANKVIDIKEVYKNKLYIADQDNFDDLIDEFNKQDSNLRVVDGYDRTLLLDYSNSPNTMDSFPEIFTKVLNNWLEEKITCPIKYTYNLLKLNENQCVLKI